MPRISTSTKLAALAEDQWGLLTRRQAEGGGISRATIQRLSDGDAVLERMARGVFHLTGAPLPDHAALRAAWLQLAPDTPAWERRPEQGVVSHRSAAALHGLGHLPADLHEFTLPHRRQNRRSDVRIHKGRMETGDWRALGGLLVTSPARTAADLLAEREDPEAVARVIVEALRRGQQQPADFAKALSPRAAGLGVRRGDGVAALASLLNLTGDPSSPAWLLDAAGDSP